MNQDMQALLHRQSGVIARWQVLNLGGSDVLLRRLLRRRELVPVHRGVYVNHTGPLTWEQRAWAAILYYWPAALAGRSCLKAHGVRDTRLAHDGESEAPIHVAIGEDRRVRRVDGVRIHRMAGLSRLVQPNREPPRLRLEHALLDVAAAAQREDEAVAVLGDACQARRSTARRMLDALGERPKLPHRRLLREVLADVASGAYSALERRYLIRVERRHGLPTGKRQRGVGRSKGYRDVRYPKWRTIVELDGRLGHEQAGDRWLDLDRDIEALEEDQVTLRLGWKQVLQSCRAAGVVARILRARGWTGQPKPCSRDCEVLRRWFPG